MLYKYLQIKICLIYSISGKYILLYKLYYVSETFRISLMGVGWVKYKVKIQSESDALRELKLEEQEALENDYVDEEQAILIASKEGRVVAYC